MFRYKTVYTSILILTALIATAQEITPDYRSIADEISGQPYKDDSGYNLVQLPAGYEKQAKIALSHYPELKGVKIRFKKKKGGAPFVSRPTIWGTFFKKPENRGYLIFIRTKPDKKFGPILMQNMPLNAQIGALGHELAHTLNFTKKGLGKMIRVIWGNLSRKYMDKFEYNTDLTAIEHGLGFQVLAWSRHASKTLRFNEPENTAGNKKIEDIIERERYMLPPTIIKTMAALSMYKDHRQLLGAEAIND